MLRDESLKNTFFESFEITISSKFLLYIFEIKFVQARGEVLYSVESCRDLCLRESKHSLKIEVAPLRVRLLQSIIHKLWWNRFYAPNSGKKITFGPHLHGRL